MATMVELEQIHLEVNRPMASATAQDRDPDLSLGSFLSAGPCTSAGGTGTLTMPISSP